MISTLCSFIFISHLHLYPYFDLIYISHLLILLPAVELEHWENCSLSSKTDSDFEDVNSQLQSERKSREENGNQGPVIFIVFV